MLCGHIIMFVSGVYTVQVIIEMVYTYGEL